MVGWFLGVGVLVVDGEGYVMGVRWGVDAGQQPLIPADIAERITAERAAGTSLRAIAAGLNDDGIPTAKGGANWYASTVSHVLKSPRGQQLQAAG